ARRTARPTLATACRRRSRCHRLPLFGVIISSVMTPNETPEKTIRLLRPSVVVLCGPAACGKSTFAVRHFRPTQIISSDHCRALVCDDEQDQRFQPQAFALLHFIIEQRLNI